MCGISCFWARESSPDIETLANFIKYGEERGTDAFGYCKYLGNRKVEGTKFIGVPAEYVSVCDKINLKLGEMLITNHRAAPETEPPVTKEEAEKRIQPIINTEHGLVLSHNGSVSNKIVNGLRSRFSFNTDLDSEAIIFQYISSGKNMKTTMETLSGGFAFVMLDVIKNRLYAVTTHNPLYAGYVRGTGFMISSSKDAISTTISKIKNIDINKCGYNVWEDYYFHQIKENTILEMDIDSGMTNEIKFEPRYITSTYDRLYVDTMGERKPEFKTLVSHSGGLDSSATLALLKKAGMNPVSVYFKYGHRGQDAETLAVKQICEKLEVPSIVFDIEDNMKILDKGMLTDTTAEIITGTTDGLKTTAAWTCFRNHLFVTYIGALAESMIMNEKLEKVYFTGGFLNLSESGSYPDNSERFVESATKFFTFSPCGTRILPLYAFANLLKIELILMLDKLGILEDIYPLLISCDRPRVVDGVQCNCSKNGLPACGSGLLSYWAEKKSGLDISRKYYEIEEEYTAYIPNNDFADKLTFDLEKTLNKMRIPKENIEILKGQIIK
jgi:7-cyano-7-deazaguanine synthase in queuosine biosynthesis